MAKAKITDFGLQSGTERTIYVTWSWSKDHTDTYRVVWQYATGDGVWFIGSDSKVTVKQSTYSAPSNATKVRVKIKPIAKKHKVNGKDQYWWTADWTSYKEYSYKKLLTTPSAPTLTITGRVLNARVAYDDPNADHIQFAFVINDDKRVKLINAKINKGAASCSYSLSSNDQLANLYKVRCRAYKGNPSNCSASSEYSDNVGSVEIDAPTWDTDTPIRALSATSVQMDWTNNKRTDQYEVQYTTEIKFFDSSSNVQSVTVEAREVGHAEITGLETGKTWYFRVRGVNSDGKSPWSEIISITLGTPPSAPTTWSSTTTAIVGESVNLYWVHNAEDGSSQRTAMLEYAVNGTTHSEEIPNTAEKDKTSCYPLDTSSYSEGAEITWRVKTAGATGEYGDWSVTRSIQVYARPSVDLTMENQGGEFGTTVISFPIAFSAIAHPDTQTPVGYHLSITADEGYDITDELGQTRHIRSGDAVFSRFYDVSQSLRISLSAGDIDLENNIHYTARCLVAMDSGLTAEDAIQFDVAWTEDVYNPFADIFYDPDTISTSIRPYCEDENGNELDVTGVTYLVYRREFDGSFTELTPGTDISTVPDPHPSLDYARYRIVARLDATGAISYADLPGYYIGEKSIVLQWAEEWTPFDALGEDPPEQPACDGSMVKLPYNIDTSEKHDKDTELVNYIGRKFPVSYYGTNLSTTATWNVDIDKRDVETIYALRRLALWTGNVYVREPSGSGYWATVGVSFSQKHLELVIPVTITITRVEGGM